MSRPISTDRHVVCGLYIRGAQPADIAREFGVKPNAVRMMLTRAGVYRPTKVGQPGTKSPEARAKTEAQKASLAEFVAEGGTPSGWERKNNITTGRGSQLWRRIVSEMGAQAV